MKSYLFDLLYLAMMKVFPEQFHEKVVKPAQATGAENQRKMAYYERQSFRVVQQDEMVGERVIVFGNDWCDLRVGYVTDFDGSIPVIFDVLSSQTFLTFGKVVYYTPERLKLFLSMTPQQRWDLVMALHADYRTKEDFGLKEDKGVTLMAPDAVLFKLDRAGFAIYPKWEEFHNAKVKNG
jgi:hypothetical protein